MKLKRWAIEGKEMSYIIAILKSVFKQFDGFTVIYFVDCFFFLSLFEPRPSRFLD